MWHYRLRGYRILEQNVWMGGNELDLVVRRGMRLAFVEVKAKGTDGMATRSRWSRRRSNAASAALRRRGSPRTLS